MSNLKQALSLPNIPEITQTVLNLGEFMEHCEEATVSHGWVWLGGHVTWVWPVVT